MQFAISEGVAKRPIDEVKKGRIMNHLIASVSQSTIALKIDKKIFDNSLQAFETYTQVALNQSQLSSILGTILSENPSLAEQCSLKALIASAIARLWQWHSPKVQSKLILAALLSDVGLKDAKHLLTKKRFEYTAAETKEYEQHPYTSYEILKQIPDIPEEILLVAIQHHENPMSLGFPQKLPRSKTHSFSKLIHAIGVFIESIYEQEDRTDIKKCLDHIHEAQSKSVSEQSLKSLYILFNLEPPKALASLMLPNETTRVI